MKETYQLTPKEIRKFVRNGKWDRPTAGLRTFNPIYLKEYWQYAGGDSSIIVLRVFLRYPQIFSFFLNR